jgi:hypothetical protein
MAIKYIRKCESIATELFAAARADNEWSRPLMGEVLTAKMPLF